MSEEPLAGVFSRGETIGQYRIEDVIGEGGMGLVYRANQPSFHRDVAIKVLPRARSSSRTFRKRFEQEAEALKQLNHPNIVSIIDKGSKNDNHFLVMELLRGHSLEELLQSGPFPPEEAFDLILQIASAVQYAHDRGIVHRDLKPANVLLDDLGTPKVADFGIAQSMIRAEGSQMQQDEQVGTAEYAAPEQLVDSSMVDQRTDIYALGAILYEILTGLPPVGRLQPVHELVSGVEPKVDRVIRKAMSPGKENRYESAAEFAAAIRAAQKIRLPEEGPPFAWKKLVVRLCAGVVGIGVVWGLAALLSGGSEEKPPKPAPSAGGKADSGQQAVRTPTTDQGQGSRKPPKVKPPPVEPSPREQTSVTKPPTPPDGDSSPQPPEPAPPSPPQTPAENGLASARRLIEAGRYQAAVEVLKRPELGSSEEASKLLSKARKAESNRLLASARERLQQGDYVVALIQARASLKFGGGGPARTLERAILDSRREWLIQRAEEQAEENPRLALADLKEAHEIRKGPDISKAARKAKYWLDKLEEQEENNLKYYRHIKQGDIAAANKNVRMAEMWYKMAQKIKDTPEVREKLKAIQ